MEIPENYKDIEGFDVQHGLAIGAFCDKFGLSTIVDKALDCQMDVSFGKIAKGLINYKILFYHIAGVII